MNSRILKKLSKRAERHTEAFRGLLRVEDGEIDPVQVVKFDRKHKETWCRDKSRRNDYVCFLDKTPAYGSTSGGYEPEWQDSPAYFILKDCFMEAFTNYNERGVEYVGPTRPVPSVVFAYFGI